MQPLRRSNRVWWTRDRVIIGLKQFYEDFKLLPTCSTAYQKHKAFTGLIRNGRASNLGWHHKYPTYLGIANYFAGMREAWRAVAAQYPELRITVDRGYEDWTPEEEWFICESVGLIPRTQVAALLKRSEPAIKRRLYDLGVNAYNRWGWTIHHVARVLCVRHDVIRKYIEGQALPFFQGNKCIYLDPADLFVIQEYNWNKKRHPKELEQAVRQSLMLRVYFALRGYNYRRYSYHRIQPIKSFQTGHIEQTRTLPDISSLPTSIKAHSWVQVATDFTTRGLAGRIGQVKRVHWAHAWKSTGTQRVTGPPSWNATIVFKKRAQLARGNSRTITYGVPLTNLIPVTKPKEASHPRLRVGSWVQVNSTYTPSSLRTKRIGKLIHLRYAIPPRVSPKTQPTRCWVATVEFDKLHNSGNPETTTIRYRVPAKFIKNVPRSQAPKRPPLSINDQVRVRATPKTKGNRAGRTGYITCIYLSAYTKRRRIARPKAQWLIRVRFPKLRGWKKSRTGFIEYCFTPDLLKAIKTSTQKQQSIKA